MSAPQLSNGKLNARTVIKDRAQQLLQQATVRKAAVLFAVILTGSVAYLGRQGVFGNANGATAASPEINEFSKTQLDEQIKQTFFTNSENLANATANFAFSFTNQTVVQSGGFCQAQSDDLEQPFFVRAYNFSNTLVTPASPLLSKPAVVEPAVVPAPAPTVVQAQPKPQPAPSQFPSAQPVPSPTAQPKAPANVWRQPTVQTAQSNHPAKKTGWATEPQFIFKPSHKAPDLAAPVNNQQPTIEITHGLPLMPELYTMTRTGGTKAAFPKREFFPSLSMPDFYSEKFSFSDFSLPKFSFSLWSEKGDAIRQTEHNTARKIEMCSALNGTNVTFDAVETDDDHAPAPAELDVENMPVSRVQILATLFKMFVG